MLRRHGYDGYRVVLTCTLANSPTMGWVPAKKYRIKLDSEERRLLTRIRDEGSNQAVRYKRAMVLLLSDEGEQGPAKIDSEIVSIIGISQRSVERLRERCHKVGALGALEPKPRNRSKDPKITGEVEARIIALACGEAPKGASRWSIRLLAEKAVELDIIESIGRESIRVILKKANLDLGNKSAGVFPPKKIQPS